MAKRSAELRYSNSIWIAETAGSYEGDLRPFWLPILKNQDWLGYEASQTGELLLNLLATAKRPEFRHLPPFKSIQEQLQGGKDSSFERAAVEVPEPRFLPLRVSARGRPFRVEGPTDFDDVSARICGQLFLSGYLVVELRFRVRGDAHAVASERLWELARALSPNETRSDLTLSKPGLTGSPRDFALGVLAGSSHSLMASSNLRLKTKDRWHLALMAVNGPDRAPAEIIGHRQYGMKNIGSGDFQAGERGYYYVEDSRIQHRNVRRRFETLRAIFDFARYQRDCLQWAKGAAVQIEADLTNANLIGGTERLALNVGEAALFAKTLAEFIRSLDGIMSTSSSASKWQRRLYSLFAGPLDLPEAHKKYEKHAAALSNEVRSLRGRGTVADASEAAKREVDIFISYSRNDIVRVTPLKKILDELGLEVFLDIDGGIDAGDAWAEVIGDAVFRAKVVLGCWTPHALSRTWVRDECSMAVNSKKLVPVAIEPISKADLRVFEVRDYVDLTDFSGHGIHLGWARTLAAIANMLDAWCAQNPDHSHSAQTTARASVVRKAAELARKGH